MKIDDSKYIGKRVYGFKDGIHKESGILTKIIFKGKNKAIVYQIKCASDNVVRNFSGIYVPMYN
jgi:hypothetical protein